MASPLQSFLFQLGYALFEYLGDGQFALLGDPPAWFKQLWPAEGPDQNKLSLSDKSPFIASFLFDAESFWTAQQPGALDSEVWIEKSSSGTETPLRATALLLEERPILAICSPDSQYRERVQTLQAARNSVLTHEKLLREIQKKEILLHCIIHDLSQPLSVMSVALDSVSGEPISPRTAEFLELGKRASDQQQSMIRDVLQAFSADLHTTLDAEQSANNSPDLFRVAREVAESQSPPFVAKNVRLHLAVPAAPAECRVTGEESRLRRIFANLLENALRYSPPGSCVTVGFEDTGSFCQAYVDDEGPGLPQDLTHAQIFGLLSKGKESAGKAGLGLYFCRITVQRWGGTIGCASLPGKGSRFWFRLPKAAAQTLASPIEHTAQTSSSSRNPTAAFRKSMRVLLADDQEEIRRLTTFQLKRCGHHVTSVANGSDALDAFRRYAFDVLLLDDEMPGLTGTQVARTIREDASPKQNRPILIALTGNNTSEDRERLLAAGFDSVLAKPFRLEALTSLFRDPAHIHPDAASLSSPEPGSLDDILRRTGADKKLLRKMIGTFLRDTPKRLAGIRTAFLKKDATQLASFAHALKGSVGIFEASLAHHLGETMQDLARAGDFREVGRIFPLLQEEIAKLMEKLRGYAKDTGARPGSIVARTKSKSAVAGKARRPAKRKHHKPGVRRKK